MLPFDRQGVTFLLVDADVPTYAAWRVSGSAP